MIALLVGTLLAVAALYYVLDPLFRQQVPRARVAQGRDMASGEERRVDESAAIEALREIEFDRATGKLSDSDYAALRERYTSAAVAALRASDNRVAAAAGAAKLSGDVEALVARFRGQARSCPECGPRAEPDAVYCSNCGRYVAGACAGCGSMPFEPGARFCSSCGAGLAA
jgi:hypothetical protein